ncbi:UNKNOWN [Stylonychia lemnae]|uniref:Uncharacterized protein n=1 Tax=Stylonychia lemnae TaxID=5949 RepID=A0A078AVG6_STYLE|nr:UNKNOWN [Stylonychia lemnae]|eukprot:CDW85267.1 UNKNOWN [Stylonychia lemnae]
MVAQWEYILIIYQLIADWTIFLRRRYNLYIIDFNVVLVRLFFFNFGIRLETFFPMM